MSIPKIIHYCWFGKKELPEKVRKCIQSWKYYCPNYTIIEWNESNYDTNKISYVKEAYENSKWAYVADYVRLDVVFQHGGIYLDTDVELCAGIDKLLNEKAFFGIEKYSLNINSGVGFGTEKNYYVLHDLMRIYQNEKFVLADGKLNMIPCPRYTTEYFQKYGYVLEDRTQRIGDTLILSSEYFCPMDFKTGRLTVTENTLGIHWYDMSWFSESDRHIQRVEYSIKKYLPLWFADILCICYRNGYRFVEYTRKGTLKEKIVAKFTHYRNESD